MRDSVLVVGADDGQPGGILPAGLFGFVGIAGTVALKRDETIAFHRG